MWWLWWWLWLCWTAVAARAAAELRCSRQSRDTSLQLECLRDGQFCLRMTYSAPPERADTSLVLRCDPRCPRAADYDTVLAHNLTLGPAHGVVLRMCPLPAGRLDSFLGRLGVTGTRSVNIASHAVLNDTLSDDFLAGLDVRALRLDSVTRVEVCSQLLRSAVRLENLTITGTNTSLPADLLRYTRGLRRLGLYNLNAGQLPPSLLDGQHNLTILALGRNGLHSLSGRHFRDLQQLQILDLYKNQLETLPADTLAALPQLQVLRVESNPLRSLPSQLLAGTTMLKVLRLNGGFVTGQLSTLPATLLAGLSQLQRLTLDRLGLQRLPDGLFVGLTALRNLTLDHNQLTSMPERLLAGLTSLQNLDLSSNRLTTVPATLLRGLGQLDTLRLNDNLLTTLPAGLLRHAPRLGRLMLHDNRLSRVTRAVFSDAGSSLWRLDLSNNSLQTDSSAALQPLKRLRELNLQHNLIESISDVLQFSLLKLKMLDLRYNRLSSLSIRELNFLCRDADIYLQHNRITAVYLETINDETSDQSKANRFHIGDNPLRCDCRLVTLKQYAARLKPFAERHLMDRQFVLMTEGLRCVAPPLLAATPLAAVSADDMVCPLPDDCPANCSCSIQLSRWTVQLQCDRLPRPPLPQVKRFTTSLRVENAGLRHITNLTTAQLGNLQLSHNAIGTVPSAMLPAGLSQLRLDHNNISSVDADFMAFLRRPENNATRVWLGDNPWRCDCAVLPLYQYLQRQLSGGQPLVVDAARITCVGRNRSLLELRLDQVCPSSTTAVITLAVVGMVFAGCLLLGSFVYYRHGEWMRVWLYSRGWCLWWVTEQELDADKKYDAFISYSHLDEDFVVEQLVPHLEQGEPKYSLCLHFRDWLAGEWITDQIQRSVQESRRVIVVLSQNFIRSEWGRLEFLAAHRQALGDRTNRLIVIVYGELPPLEAMDHELRLYITSNTYLRWGDALFWQRLRYALPHHGHRSKRRRRHISEKLGLMALEHGLQPVSPPAQPEAAPVAKPGDAHRASNGEGPAVAVVTASQPMAKVLP